MGEPAYRRWVVFRFAESIDYWNLVEVERSEARNTIEALSLLGPTRRLRRRDGFVLTDPRMRPREVLSEIHYCVLCHDRDPRSFGQWGTQIHLPSVERRRYRGPGQTGSDALGQVGGGRPTRQGPLRAVR